MPESPDTDLESIKTAGEEKIKTLEGQITKYEEQPIAFGLKALIAFIRIDEKTDTQKVEDVFKDIPNISSLDIIDYRREL